MSTSSQRVLSQSDVFLGLLPPERPSPNLTVLVNAYVSKIVLDPGSDGQGLKATGVEFFHASSDRVYVAHATKEVVLSAGYVLPGGIIS